MWSLDMEKELWWFKVERSSTDLTMCMIYSSLPSDRTLQTRRQGAENEVGICQALEVKDGVRGTPILY